MKKIKIVYLIYVLLLSSFLLFRPQDATAAGGPSLSISPASLSVNVGSNFNLEIILNTDGQKIDGVDVNALNFDPNLLQAVKVENGPIFPVYLGNRYDNNEGKITISGIINPGGEPYSGSGTFAKVTFKAKNQGIAKLNFDFTLGATQDSNISAHSESKDILASANGAEISILKEGEAIPTTQNGTLTNGTTGSDNNAGALTNQESGISSSPSNTGTNQLRSFLKKETEIAGYKSSVGEISLMIAIVILIIIGLKIIFYIRKRRSQRINKIN